MREATLMQKRAGCTPRGSAAFALPELLAIVCVGVVLVCLLAMIAADTRRQAGLHHSLSNLRQIGTLHHAYAADNSERIATFSWYPGNQPSSYPDLRDGTTDQQAAANQAVDMLRRLAGMEDMPRIAGWVPQILYSHLVLAEYAGTPLADPMHICPGDRTTMSWLQSFETDPTGQAFFDLERRPSPDNTASLELRRWIFSSSYELGSAFFSWPEGGTGALTQGQTHRGVLINHLQIELGRRTMDEVAFPSDKAMVYARHDWYHGDVALFFAYTDARTPILAADGAARARTTRQINRGFNPGSPHSFGSTTIAYTPSPDWEPPLRDGSFGAQPLAGHHRWTRSGLRGRDFNGPEIPWDN